MTLDVKKLQERLQVPADGVLGRGTLAALFARVGAKPDVARELALAGLIHMSAAGLFASELRLAHFLAQVGHESGGFRYMEELASGAAYEGRADLGNVVKGDGVRYKGRGPLQLTGRANYRAVGRAFGVDLESHPELAAVPSIGLWIACHYWTTRSLNDAADADDLERITRRVNGGLNGLADRQSRLTMLKGMLL